MDVWKTMQSHGSQLYGIIVHATYSSSHTHALTSNSENKLPPMLYVLFLMNEERSSMLVPGLPFSMSE